MLDKYTCWDPAPALLLAYVKLTLNARVLRKKATCMQNVMT